MLFLALGLIFPALAHAEHVGVPERGCLVGADIGPTEESNQAAMARFNVEAGKSHAFFHRYVDLRTDEFSGYGYTAEAFCNAADNVGAVPFLTIEPWNATYSSVLTSRDVAWVERFAADCGRWGKPMMIRFAHEMNGNWYPWGWQKTTAGAYVQAFRTFGRIFRAKAPNVSLVWAPNQNWGPVADDAYSNWYPGDEYVDWVGLSVYHWYFSELNSDQFARNVLQGSGAEGNFHREFAVGHNKPMILAETACGDDFSDYYDNKDYAGRFQNETGTYGTRAGQGAQSWWIDQIYKVGGGYPAIDSSMPMLKAVMWYARPYVRSYLPKPVDFQIAGADRTTHSLDFSAYRRAVSNPYFSSDAVGPSTTFTSSPAAPDGRYGWYVSRPTITLAGDSWNTVRYRWGGAGTFSDYAGPLTVSEGRRVLDFYSVDARGMAEAPRRAVIKVDTSAPALSRVAVLPRGFTPRRGQRTRARYVTADNLSGRMAMMILVYDRSRRFVCRVGPSWRDRGYGSTVWNGRNSRGRIVRRGTYLLRVVARDVAGNRTDSSLRPVFVR